MPGYVDDPLGDRINAMEALVNYGDIEGAHGRADDLLIDTLRYLAPLCIANPEGTIESVEQIIAAYNAIEKWYA